ncbi:hypothetical protein [Allomesorhizobium camelthorni]|uniref:Uncharacterized protein n=1 Tax=Allomesorhizobium camelthorni TaxID=475069 RepID=A0A6G4WHX9_9HYPH|nr:hypothetical protein [Mesorhizobium camelthorni]NGO54214.1 hypothetical protein [Mesorhizobium camelthorni]
MESQFALISIATVTVLSGGAAAIITLTVDVRERPGIQSVVEGLMRIAILGAGALVALTDGGRQIVGIASLVAFALAAYALWRPSIPAWLLAAAANGGGGVFPLVCPIALPCSSR